MVIVAGLFLVAWWLEAYGLSRAYSRRERDRELEANNLRHIPEIGNGGRNRLETGLKGIIRNGDGYSG